MPIHSQAKRLLRTLTGVAVAAVTLPGASSAIAATATPDPFYEYTDSTPLSSYAPGTVLKTRTITWVITVNNLHDSRINDCTGTVKTRPIGYIHHTIDQTF